jgi:hypothetical protein
MKPTPTILILSAVAALTLYIGGYFVVVHKRLQNPFISWPIRTPRPMVEYYQVPSLRVIYDPLVHLDKKTPLPGGPNSFVRGGQESRNSEAIFPPPI